MSMLNLKSSFSKKDVRLIAVELNIDATELELALADINKTMLGKELVVDTLYQIAISVNTDETGSVYTPDQLIADIVKKCKTPTFSGTVLQSTIKEIWTAVSPTLHQYPQGHALIKALIVEINKELCGKNATGVKQVRELVKMKSLELYSQF